MMPTHCAFCERDPQEQSPLGSQAVTCCELGCAIYDHRNEDDVLIEVGTKELRQISDHILDLRWQVERRNRIIEKLFYHRSKPGRASNGTRP
jgi:hypothetical protein